MILAAIVLVALLAFIFALRGRKGHPDISKFSQWSYAHRGLHGNGIPENSLAAFCVAKDKGYGIELDVHLLADGNLAVMHDSSLKRTTGYDVQIESLTQNQLAEYRLEGTDHPIPLLKEVLSLIDGEVPLIIELKSQVDQYAELCERTCELLENYSGLYCLESFDPRCIVWLRKYRPHLVRGQLAENYLKAKDYKVPFFVKLVLSNHLMNFLSVPDFIAYRATDTHRFVNRFCRKVWGMAGVAWTIDSKEVYDRVKEEGWIPIFEGFEP